MVTELADQTVTVLDIISRVPIAGASVTIGGITVTTDQNGVATFPTAVAPTPTPTPMPGARGPAPSKPQELGTSTGASTVTVSAPWYFASSVTFSGDTVEVDLWPYSVPIAIGAVVVVGGLVVVGAKVAGWF